MVNNKMPKIVCIFLGIEKEFIRNISNKINFENNYIGIYYTKNNYPLKCIWAIGQEIGYKTNNYPTINQIKKIVENADLVLTFGFCGAVNNKIQKNDIISPNKFYNYNNSKFINILNSKNQYEKIQLIEENILLNLNNKNPIIIWNYFVDYQKNLKGEKKLNTPNLTVPYFLKLNSLDYLSYSTKNFFFNFNDSVEMELFHLININIKKIGIYLHTFDLINSNSNNNYYKINKNYLEFNINFLIENSIKDFLNEK